MYKAPFMSPATPEAPGQAYGPSRGAAPGPAAFASPGPAPGAFNHGSMSWPGPFDSGGCGVDVAIGAASPAGAGIVASINAAQAQQALNKEDGAEIYKTAKTTDGGSGKWWIDVGVAAGAGVIVGYVLGKMF